MLNLSAATTILCVVMRSFTECRFLIATYSARLIGLVAWPPRSPDLCPQNFFFWGHWKAFVFEAPVHSVENLVVRNVVSPYKINTTPGICVWGAPVILSLAYSYMDGCHSEHLL
ncbi:hypothetical protein TNCV_1864391 [Trichonephila clavipes]|nr:hypothetical protein TNCV_1864391 [Trichonephila clavipes]